MPHEDPSNVQSEQPGSRSDDDLWFTPRTGDPEIDTLETYPINFTGDHDFDPREKGSYPESPEQNADLLLPRGSENSDEQQVKAEELSSQMSRIQADHNPNISPKPLTLTGLKNHLMETFPKPYNEVTCWIPSEPDSTDQMAVGEYRKHVDGFIVRYSIEMEDGLITAELIPDTSPTGFSWYVQVDNSPITTGGQLEMSQSRRLEALLQTDDPEGVVNPPTRVLNASKFLSAPLTGAETQATADDWTTTQCKIDAEESESFLPRYKATFVHEPTDIVVEISPIPVTDDDRRQIEEQLGAPSNEFKHTPDQGHHPEEEPSGPTHRYELHFADPELEETIHAQFPTETTGAEVLRLLDRISELA